MTTSQISSIAAGIIAAEIVERRNRYDKACKRLLSEKIILGWLLHECLEEYRLIDPKDIAEHLIEGVPEVGETPVHPDGVVAPRIVGMNSEDSSLSEGTIWYDIRFSALLPGSKELIGMVVNVEAQNDFYPGYSLLQRASYYCARMMSAQYGRTFTHPHYERIQKVCSIWICPNPPASYRNTVTRYAMTETNLVGSASARRDEYDLTEIVLVCPDGDRQKKGDGILRLMGMLLASDEDSEVRKSVISEEFDIPMSEQLSDEVDDMADLSKGVFERGYNRGLELGREQGIEKGIEQGIEQAYEQVSRLAAYLSEQGRADELLAALTDPQALGRLMAELPSDE